MGGLSISAVPLMALLLGAGGAGPAPVLAGTPRAPLGSVQPPSPVAQPARPFGVGERLEYQVSLGTFGSGEGSLEVAPTGAVRDEPSELLRFDFEAKLGPLAVAHHSRSWLSVSRLASLRYALDERSPLKVARAQVELFPDERRWEGSTGRGASLTSEPLDELSFLYAIRTLPLAPGRSFRLARHYDPRKNPARVEVLGRETVQVPAGAFSTLVVAFTVEDRDRCGGPRPSCSTSPTMRTAGRCGSPPSVLSNSCSRSRGRLRLRR